MHIAKRLVVVVGLVQLIAVASASAAGNAPIRAAQPDPRTALATSGAIAVLDITNNQQTQEHTITASVSVTGTTDDDGGGNDVVCAVVFDDFVVVASQCANIPVGSTVDTLFTLQWVGPIGREAPGVGLVLFDTASAAAPDEGAPLTFIDPLFVVPIPTLSQWAQILMIGLLVAGGLWTLRRGFSGRRGMGSLC